MTRTSTASPTRYVPWVIVGQRPLGTVLIKRKSSTSPAGNCSFHPLRDMILHDPENAEGLLPGATQMASTSPKPICSLISPRSSIEGRSNAPACRSDASGAEASKSLDHLISTEEQRRRDREAQGLRRLRLITKADSGGPAGSWAPAAKGEREEQPG